MKAILVIDVDKDEFGEAVATITAEENDITFFARGVIRPLPKSITEYEVKVSYDYDPDYAYGWNECLDAITGETE